MSCVYLFRVQFFLLLSDIMVKLEMW